MTDKKVIKKLLYTQTKEARIPIDSCFFFDAIFLSSAFPVAAELTEKLCQNSSIYPHQK